MGPMGRIQTHCLCRHLSTFDPRLLDAVVHTLEGSGPGRLELTSEMKEAGIRLYECHPGLVSKDSTISPLVELGASIIGVLSGG